MSSPITTHVLDTAKGCPAAGITVQLEKRSREDWIEIGSGVTNHDGRVVDLIAPGTLEHGHHRLNFATAAYFVQSGSAGFYPVVQIDFEVRDPQQHYHVPLLLSPFGYSTYRGS